MPDAPPPQLPTGTVTFLFTDIEGSTLLLQRLGNAYLEVIEAHDALMRTAIEANRGIEVSTEGDSFFAVFASAVDAVRTAAEAQLSLAAYSWPADTELRVRMGLHTGIGTLGGTNYVGLDVHRAARVAAAAHGGQTVLSGATAALAERNLPAGVTLRDLGKHRLKDLSDPESIFQLVVADLASDFPPLRTLNAVPNNLPLQLTSFVGREQDLREAARLLEQTRILTLVGPGGTGKSRLALQLAADLAEQFDDGVHFVELSPVTDPEFVPAAVLSAIGWQAPAQQAPKDWLLTQLPDRRLLMVLDNFEQVLEAAPLVGEMVRAAPNSKFVVTSRAPIHIQGEQEMPVPPLGIAPVGSSPSPEALLEAEGIRLFVERAMSAEPSFRLTAENAEPVAELVGRLDGLPLAIELVASRVKLLPVPFILERLDLHSLGRGPHDVPARQQTLWNAIDWSYELLNKTDRRLFARMSVFAGSARLQTIEAVCGPDLGTEVLDSVFTLVDHSLVERVANSADARFRLLHVIREYAAEQLQAEPDAPRIHRLHAQTLAAFAERATEQLHSTDRKMWLDEMDADHENLRVALRWAIDNDDTNLAMRITWAAWRFWQARGYLHEARRHVGEVLDMPNGDLFLRAKTLEACGGIDWWRGDMASCINSYRPALEIQRELGDPAEIANALYNLALAVSYAEQPVEDASELLEEAEQLYESIGSTGGLANINWGRGNLMAYGRGEVEAGREFFRRSIDQYRQAGDQFGLGWALFEYGDTSRRLGEFETARRNLTEGLELLHGHGDLSAVVLFLAALAGLSRELNQMERAARLAGVVHKLRVSTGADIVIRAATLAGEMIDDLRGDTGPLAEAFEQGRAMDLAKAVAYAVDGN